MSEKFTIYCHTNRVNGKKYVGQTKNSMARRWSSHCRGAGGGLLFAAIKKYGTDAFDHTVLEVVPTQYDADAAETLWIEKTGSLVPHGYNIALGGGTTRYTSEMRERAKAWWTPERRAAAKERSHQIAQETPKNVQSAWAKRAIAQQTPEQLSDRARKGNATKGLDLRRAYAAKAIAKQSKEQLRERSEKRLRTVGPGGYVAGAKRRWAKLTQEERTAIAMKGCLRRKLTKKYGERARLFFKYVNALWRRKPSENLGFGC